jgi:hypothetical protein
MAEKKAESGAIRACYSSIRTCYLSIRTCYLSIRACYLPIRACIYDLEIEDTFVSTIKIKIDFNFVLFSLIRIFAAE